MIQKGNIKPSTKTMVEQGLRGGSQTKESGAKETE